MEAKSLPSVSHAFARIAWRTVAVLLVFAFGLFAISSYRLLRGYEEHDLNAQARLCSFLIRSGDDSEFKTVAAVLQAYSRSFVAVAVVGEKEREISSIYPDSPVHRAAALAAVSGEGKAVRAISPNTQQSAGLVALNMPVQQSCLTTKRVYAVFEASSVASSLLALLVLFGLLAAGAAVAAFSGLRRWFDRHIVHPLQSFGAIVVNGQSDQAAAHQWSGTSLETARLGKVLQEFVQALGETSERAKRAEEDSLKRIQDQEAGYNQQLRRIRDQATTDPLTRLKNRAFLDESLEPLFRAHCAACEPLAAVMLDLDNFKNYNDTNGHQAGDALLRFIGALLRGAIRPTDHAVRYGGDEFLLLLPQANAKQAAAIADRIVKLFRQYSSCLQQDHRLSMSAGVAAIPDHPCDNGEGLIAKADRTLYSAKAAGKDAVFVGATNGQRAYPADPPPPPLSASAA